MFTGHRRLETEIATLALAFGTNLTHSGPEEGLAVLVGFHSSHLGKSDSLQPWTLVVYTFSGPELYLQPPSQGSSG